MSLTILVASTRTISARLSKTSGTGRARRHPTGPGSLSDVLIIGRCVPPCHGRWRSWLWSWRLWHRRNPPPGGRSWLWQWWSRLSAAGRSFATPFGWLRIGATNMDTLIAIGTSAALAVTAWLTIELDGRHLHAGRGGALAAALHSVMAPLIIAVVATGRAIEERAKKRASVEMHSLLSLRPPLARTVPDADDELGALVAPETVPVGALIRIRPGEVVPLDGSVMRGWSAVDESMPTGEPLPVEHGPGSQVTGGSRSLSGTLVVKVTATAAESVLTRLQGLVDAAQQDRAPLQQVADRITAIFVPAVLCAALAAFLGWWCRVGKPFEGSLERPGRGAGRLSVRHGARRTRGHDGRLRPGRIAWRFHQRVSHHRASGQNRHRRLRQDRHADCQERPAVAL